MEFEKQHDTTDKTDFCPHPFLRTCYRFVIYFADLLWTCYREVANLLPTNLLQGNWCNGFWL